jgi:hypothetical protein
MTIVKRETTEFGRMWDALAEMPVNAGLPCPCEAEDARTGERWQYMATVNIAGQWLHQFRHRQHPRTQARIVINVPAAAWWKPAADTANQAGG